MEGQRIRTGRRRPSKFVRADQRSEAQIRSRFPNGQLEQIDLVGNALSIEGWFARRNQIRRESFFVDGVAMQIWVVRRL